MTGSGTVPGAYCQEGMRSQAFYSSRAVGMLTLRVEEREWSPQLCLPNFSLGQSCLLPALLRPVSLMAELALVTL